MQQSLDVRSLAGCDAFSRQRDLHVQRDSKSHPLVQRAHHQLPSSEPHCRPHAGRLRGHLLKVHRLLCGQERSQGLAAAVLAGT